MKAFACLYEEPFPSDRFLETVFQVRTGHSFPFYGIWPVVFRLMKQKHFAHILNVVKEHQKTNRAKMF